MVSLQKFRMALMSIVLSVHPGYNWTPGRTTKKDFAVRFGHGRDLAAFNGTGLQNKSFQDKQGLTPFGTRKRAVLAGGISINPCGSVGA